MRYIICFLLAALLVLHQARLFQDDPTLVFGWLPIGLLYHGAISLAAGAVWWLAATFAWPVDPFSLESGGLAPEIGAGGRSTSSGPDAGAAQS